MYNENSRFGNFEDRVPRRRPSTRQPSVPSVVRRQNRSFPGYIDVGTLLHEIAQVHHAINRPSGVELVFTTGLLPESTDDHRKAARYSAVRMACLPPNYITSGTRTSQ